MRWNWRRPTTDLNRGAAKHLLARGGHPRCGARQLLVAGGERTAIVANLLHLRDTRSADEKFKGARLCRPRPAYFEALADQTAHRADRVLTHPATMALAETYLNHWVFLMLDARLGAQAEVVGVLCHEHTGSAREWSVQEIDFASACWPAMVSLALEESQRARSEHLLRESKRSFGAWFEGTSQLVVLHDENGIFEANPSWFRALGYSDWRMSSANTPPSFRRRSSPGRARRRRRKNTSTTH